MRKTLTIRLIPSSRTDVPCLVCGRFRTQAVVVLPGGSEADAQVGMHRGCLPKRSTVAQRAREPGPTSPLAQLT